MVSKSQVSSGRRSKASRSSSARELYPAFYRVVAAVPPGRVVTYGQVAALAGRPRHARHVGYALAALEDGSSLPWHRVINAKGEVSERREAGRDHYQRFLLEQEGVTFTEHGRVRLELFRWEPE